MGKKLLITLTQPVQARLIVAVVLQAVLRTLTVTGEEPTALAALPGQCRRFGQAEQPLLLTIEHFGQRLSADIP